MVTDIKELVSSVYIYCLVYAKRLTDCKCRLKEGENNQIIRTSYHLCSVAFEGYIQLSIVFVARVNSSSLVVPHVASSARASNVHVCVI